MKTKIVEYKIIGYDSSLALDKELRAETFCKIANTQVIPLFEALELELNEKDIKAAVTSRQTAKELYSQMIGDTTPKKDKGILRKLMQKTASTEFDSLVERYGKQTAPYSYNCYYNADSKRMEIDNERIHNESAVVVSGDTLAAYERVEALANAINAVCNGLYDTTELQMILRAVEFQHAESGEIGKVVPTISVGRYEGIVELFNMRSC